MRRIAAWAVAGLLLVGLVFVPGLLPGAAGPRGAGGSSAAGASTGQVPVPPKAEQPVAAPAAESPKASCTGWAGTWAPATPSSSCSSPSTLWP